MKLRNNEQQKSTFCTKSLIIEGATEKVMQSSEVNLQQKTLVLINKNVIFEHNKKFEQ